MTSREIWRHIRRSSAPEPFHLHNPSRHVSDPGEGSVRGLPVRSIVKQNAGDSRGQNLLLSALDRRNASLVDPVTVQRLVELLQDEDQVSGKRHLGTRYRWRILTSSFTCRQHEPMSEAPHLNDGTVDMSRNAPEALSSSLCPSYQINM